MNDDDLNDDSPSNGLSLEDIGLGGAPAGDAGEGSGPPPSGAPAEPATPTQATSAPTTPPTGDPWMVPPKSWKKELHTHYVGLPADVQRYVHEREQQALNGVMQYKQQAEAYDKVFEPYRELLQQANVQPVQVVQNLARNHHTLATGTPEQKVALARQLMQEYGIDPRALVFGVQGQAETQQPPIPPGYDRVTETVARLEQAFMAEKRAEVQKQIDSFAAANPLYKEVEADIADLLSSGAANDLQTAYDIAIYRNPEVRQKVLQTMMTQNSQQAQQVNAGKKKATGVNLTPGSGTATSAPKSVEDTMNSILDKHYSH